MKKIALSLVIFALLFVQTGVVMAQSKSLPETEYTPGVYTVELNGIPGNAIGSKISFTRVVTNPEGDLMYIQVQQSNDNGATWFDIMGGTFSGGTMLDKNGAVLQESTFLFTWAGEAGPNGRVMLKGSDIRIVATVYQTFRTAITLESITALGR